MYCHAKAACPVLQQLLFSATPCRCTDSVAAGFNGFAVLQQLMSPAHLFCGHLSTFCTPSDKRPTTQPYRSTYNTIISVAELSPLQSELWLSLLLLLLAAG
jgi:hypothetical protein